MNPDIIVAIVLLGGIVILAFLIWAFRWITLGVSSQKRKLRRRLREAKWGLRKAILTHRFAIIKCWLQREVIEWKSAGRATSAKRELEIQDGPKGHLLSTFTQGEAFSALVRESESIQLYERWIETPCGSGPLAGVSACVETGGDVVLKSRPTLTRAAVGGVAGRIIWGKGEGWKGALGSLAFQKDYTVDMREVFLCIDAPGFSCVFQCSSDSGSRAREFAAKIQTAVKRFPEVQRDLPCKREAARRDCDEAEVDMHRVYREAEGELYSAKQDRFRLSAIEDARRDVEEARKQLRAK